MSHGWNVIFRFKKKGSLHRKEEAWSCKSRLFSILSPRECMAFTIATCLWLQSGFQTKESKHKVHHCQQRTNGIGLEGLRREPHPDHERHFSMKLLALGLERINPQTWQAIINSRSVPLICVWLLPQIEILQNSPWQNPGSHQTQPYVQSSAPMDWSRDRCLWIEMLPAQQNWSSIGWEASG